MPTEPMPTGSTPTGARRTAAFWLVAATVTVFLAAGSAPSPLYVVYQQEWDFGALTLTMVFAAYAAVLLVTLLVVGGLSDFVGRRPVILTAIVLEIVSLVFFLVADSVTDLVIGRGMQGLATGIGLGALSAGIADFAPPTRPSLGAGLNVASPTFGLAVGALMSGLLVQYAPMPTTLVYAVLAVALLALGIATVLVLPRPTQRRPGALASLRPAASVPPNARREFRNAAPVLVATWSIGGLVLSLGASLAQGVFGVTNHVIGGIVVTAMAGAASVSAFAVRNRPARTTMPAAAGILATGMATVLVSVGTERVVLFFMGLVITGVGFGSGFVSALGSVAQKARPHERAELMAAMFVPSYGAFGGASVLAGLAVPHAGLRPTTLVFGLLVIVLALLAIAAELLTRRQESAQPASRTAAVPVSALDRG